MHDCMVTQPDPFKCFMAPHMAGRPTISLFVMRTHTHTHTHTPTPTRAHTHTHTHPHTHTHDTYTRAHTHIQMHMHVRTQTTAHSTQHTAHNTQHTAHSTLRMHNAQRTSIRWLVSKNSLTMLICRTDMNRKNAHFPVRSGKPSDIMVDDKDLSRLMKTMGLGCRSRL